MDTADPVTLLELLEDEYARKILIETNDEPMSAKELTAACDASPPTIYRRLESLEEAGLVEEQTLPDSDGHHYKIYRSTIERVTFEIDGEELAADVTRRTESAADRFTRLYEEMR